MDADYHVTSPNTQPAIQLAESALIKSPQWADCVEEVGSKQTSDEIDQVLRAQDC
ncbi:hypothetical protein [Ovoidimarina sediminis]|uniref:hypothetical protein n=1 Tax=Ovoidimarina sediminis TaxID=3079856 RepID=UPI002931C90F|nr:hypothetical protein [Rhodophyticola sp. MJ-SS7]